MTTYFPKNRLAQAIAAVLALALVALAVDQTTGDETPPYHDPWYNDVAFGLFFGLLFVLAVLCVIATVRLIRRIS